VGELDPVAHGEGDRLVVGGEVPRGGQPRGRLRVRVGQVDHRQRLVDDVPVAQVRGRRGGQVGVVVILFGGSVGHADVQNTGRARFAAVRCTRRIAAARGQRGQGHTAREEGGD